MLNEFIAWDEDDRKFVTLEEFNEDEAVSERETINEQYASFLEHYFGCETFPYIGKTDDTPDKNKIYADCSIMEVTFHQDFSNHHFTIDEGSTFVGKVKFDWQGARIEQSDGTTLWFTELEFQTAATVKVIGTRQENPELLEQGE